MNRKIDEEWLPSVEQVILVKITCQSGVEFITGEKETTESLLNRLDELRSHPKNAAQILSITFAIILHML